MAVSRKSGAAVMVLLASASAVVLCGGNSDVSLKGDANRVSELSAAKDAYGIPMVSWASSDISGPLADAGSGLDAPLAVCFAPGTPKDIVTAVYEEVRSPPDGSKYFVGGRWSGLRGTPRELRWSFVPDGTTITPAGSWDNNGNSAPSELFSRMDTLFNGNRALWISLIESCFARWEELTGVSYTRITYGGEDWDDGAAWGSSGSSTRGDVRISMRYIDGGSSVLAYNFFPSNGDMVIDRNEGWGSTSNNYRYLRNVVTHEHGHGLGFQHVCSDNTNQLMEPYVNTTFDGPQHDDLRAGQRQYGDPFEDIDSAVDAAYVGTAELGTPLIIGEVPSPSIPDSSLASIDGNGEEDWFRFTVTGMQTAASLTLTPMGRHYDSSPEESSGCTCCNYVDSYRVANLNMQVVDTDGETVLATADSQNMGIAETLTDVILPAPGDYYIRVYEEGAPTETQLYEIEVTIKEPGACCMADGSCVVLTDLDCVVAPGIYSGHGTGCPPDPACEPVDALMTFELETTAAPPDTEIPVELFVEELGDLAGYQATLMITRTSGEGSVTLDCPTGAQVDDTRPDYVFSGIDSLPVAACDFSQIGAAALTSFVTVGSEPRYIGDFTLHVSPDATAGTTFEIAIDPDSGQSFAADSGSFLIPMRVSLPVTLTVLAGGKKNRYISIAPSDTDPVALRVEMTASEHFPSSTGVLGWIGEPNDDDIALVVDAPVYRVWDEGTVHVGDCEIAAGSTYEIRATEDGIAFGDPTVVVTVGRPAPKHWADVVGNFDGTRWTVPNGIVSMDDIMAAVQRFQAAETAPNLLWVDVDPEVPNYVLNMTDIMRIAQAFRGDPYPYSDPMDCP